MVLRSEMAAGPSDRAVAEDHSATATQPTKILRVKGRGPDDLVLYRVVASGDRLSGT